VSTIPSHIPLAVALRSHRIPLALGSALFHWSMFAPPPAALLDSEGKEDVAVVPAYMTSGQLPAPACIDAFLSGPRVARTPTITGEVQDFCRQFGDALNKGNDRHPAFSRLLLGTSAAARDIIESNKTCLNDYLEACSCPLWSMYGAPSCNNVHLPFDDELRAHIRRFTSWVMRNRYTTVKNSAQDGQCFTREWLEPPDGNMFDVMGEARIDPFDEYIRSQVFMDPHDSEQRQMRASMSFAVYREMKQKVASLIVKRVLATRVFLLTANEKKRALDKALSKKRRRVDEDAKQEEMEAGQRQIRGRR
jgi:hypothetical protein